MGGLPVPVADEAPRGANRDDLKRGVRHLASYIHQLKNHDVKEVDVEVSDQLAMLELLARYAPRMQAQLGQDVFALAMSGFKTGGTFIEVGAYDGIHMSNTYLLEASYGWNGALVEPNPRQTATFERRRACLFAKAAWSRSDESLTFRTTSEPALAHLASVGSTDGHDRDDGENVTVQTITLDDVIARIGAPVTVDYLSIDTEGAEMDVLAGLSLNRLNIRTISVEHAHDMERLGRIDATILPHGYRRVMSDVSDFDAYYVKEETYAAWRRWVEARFPTSV